jgi:hypothetical protein
MVDCVSQLSNNNNIEPNTTNIEINNTDIETGLRDAGYRIRIPKGTRNFFIFSKISKPVLGHI